MDSTLLSVFSLCANNAGAFKSSKQAAFFANKFGNEMSVVESYSYGEHGGSRCSVCYTVKFDNNGIISIVKSGAKSVITFERNGVNQYAENQAKKARIVEEMRNDARTIEIPYCEKTIAEKMGEIELLRSHISQGYLPDSPLFQRVIGKLQDEINELNSRLERLNKYCEVA
jgi:hypothetical protein